MLQPHKMAGRGAGGCSSCYAYGGWQPLMVRTHRLREQGVEPSWWLQLTVSLKGMAALNGAESQAIGQGVQPSRC